MRIEPNEKFWKRMGTSADIIPSTHYWRAHDVCGCTLESQRRFNTVRDDCRFFRKLFRFSWKWRKRSTVKTTERTREERTEVLHGRREGRHPKEAFAGTGAGLEAL